MCGPRARTNFPYSYNASLSRSSSSRLLSANLTAKLNRCYMASLQLTKQSPTAMRRSVQTDPIRTDFSMVSDIAPAEGVKAEVMTAAKKVKVESEDCGEPLMIEMVDDDYHIQQMIEELLDYGEIELRSASVDR